MADQPAVSSRWVTICIALMLITTATAARPYSRSLAAAEQGTMQSDRPAAAGPAGSLLPGTPAVTPSSSSATSSAEPSSSSQIGTIQEGNYGWLSPVLASTRRGNCVVYTARGSESLHDVARLFSLSAARVLADNQGVITDGHQALGGRSILLCGQHGQAAPRPVSPAAAARADAAATEEAGVPVSRKTSQTAPAAQIVAPEEQEQALLQLKAVLDPQTNVLKDWGPTQVAPEARMAVTSHCTWTYVACDSSQNVIRLNLVYLGLEGKLPPGTLLAKLPQLTELYLGGNVLQGTLPADWATYTKLTQLYLNDNQLTGPLPSEWGDMKTLKVLSVPYNQLTGSLPATWSKLKSLQDLKLNNNQLSGRVPLSWGGMDSLATITCWNNPRLSGCFPAAWQTKSSNSKGFFQSPNGMPSSDIKVATLGTAITGFCSADGTPAAAPAAAPVPANTSSPAPKAAATPTQGQSQQQAATPATPAAAGPKQAGSSPVPAAVTGPAVTGLGPTSLPAKTKNSTVSASPAVPPAVTAAGGVASPAPAAVSTPAAAGSSSNSSSSSKISQERDSKPTAG